MNISYIHIHTTKHKYIFNLYSLHKYIRKCTKHHGGGRRKEGKGGEGGKETYVMGVPVFRKRKPKGFGHRLWLREERKEKKKKKKKREREREREREKERKN